MTTIKDVLDNTKSIFMTDSALNSLMDFERVIDELDVYVFENGVSCPGESQIPLPQVLNDSFRVNYVY